MQPIDNEPFDNANSLPKTPEQTENAALQGQPTQPAQPTVPVQPVHAPYFVDRFYNPGYLEHRDIRRRGNILGFAFCLTVIVNLFLFTAISILLLPLGVDIDALATALEDPFYSMVYQIVFSMVAFLLPFMLAAAMSKEKISKIVPFKKAKKGTTVSFMLIGFGFLAAANVLSTYFSNILSTLGISDYQVDFDMPSGTMGLIITVLAVAVVPALVEEFAYRGVFLGLLKKYGEGFCIVASSVMFGLMHGNLSQIPFAFMVGLVLGFIRVKSGSMVPAVLLHFINNFVSVILSYLTAGQSIAVLVGINTVYFALAVLSIAVGILTLKKDSFEMFKLSPSDTHLYGSQKASAFYAAPVMIVAYVLTVILIVISEISL